MKNYRAQTIMKFKVVLLVFVIFLAAETVHCRDIDHVMIREKIDRVGSIQSGGEGKKIELGGFK